MANHSDVSNDAAAKASEFANKAAEYGHKAVKAVDSSRGTAASGLHDAASGLHAHAGKLPPPVNEYAQKAADSLDETADYVRDNSVADMWSDAQAFVKANPVPALLGAVAIGFIAGRMLRRS